MDDLDTLYLLELLVDSVHLNKQTDGTKLYETSLTFRFMDLPPLVISEEDFVYLGEFDTSGSAVDIIFKSGKSCLFSLPPNYYPSPGYIMVTVSRRSGPKGTAGAAEMVLVGSASIDLTGSFLNILKHTNSQQGGLPHAKVIKDKYELKNKRGETVGEIKVFVRLSCFGKLIVTTFETKREDIQEYKFKGVVPRSSPVTPTEDEVCRGIMNQGMGPGGMPPQWGAQMGGMMRPEQMGGGMMGPRPLGGGMMGPGMMGPGQMGGGMMGPPMGQYGMMGPTGAMGGGGGMMPGQMNYGATMNPGQMNYGMMGPMPMPTGPGMMPPGQMWENPPGVPYGHGMPNMGMNSGGNANPAIDCAPEKRNAAGKCITDTSTQIADGEFASPPILKVKSGKRRSKGKRAKKGKKNKKK